MTTIAWDGTTLAGDRRLSGGFNTIGAAKIARTADGRLIGCAGITGNCRVMMAWLMKAKRNIEIMPECQDDEDDAVQAIEILRNGTVRYYERSGMMLIEDVHFAIGSGSPFAIAAMHCGKAAYAAVEVAARFDSMTGGSIDSLTLNQ